jgi:cell division protein ZapA (FtsZ GTPase activity inhibitor)
MTEGRADVEILGQRLSVRGRGTPEYIHELADYLNGRIESVRDQARVFDPLRLSLLAGPTLWTSCTGSARPSGSPGSTVSSSSE